MAAWSGLTLLESHVHYPPPTEENRHDYPRIDIKNHYWGDAVGVFKKPADYPLEMQVMNRAVRRWANQASEAGPLGFDPGPSAGLRPAGGRERSEPVSGPAVLGRAKGAGRKPSVQDRILKAAAEEFTAHGLAGSRGDRIAHAAGLADRDEIVDVFGDKSALFEAVVAKGLITLENAEALRG